ncbi:MAG: GNAT family N-acetyltransferase [Thermodesulfobacteriota bacterium]
MSAIREAGKADIPLLVLQHRMMFEEIRALMQKSPDPAKLAAMDECYREKLLGQLSTPACAAFLAVEGGHAAGSVGVSIVSMVPVPEDPQDRVAYIHSLYVEKAFRSRGIARGLMSRAVDHCRALGIVRVQLAASAAGKPLYESMGFAPLFQAMGLRLYPS